MAAPRRAFTLLELLIVLVIMGVMFGLLLMVLVRAGEAGKRASCLGNLREIGRALNNYHAGVGCFPPGLVCRGDNVSDAETTGFALLLPFLDQEPVARIYHFDKPWWDESNYQAVGTEVKVLYCPSNRVSGGIKLGEVGSQWGMGLPPYAAGTDYAFCHGANAALPRDWRKMPLKVRGVFGIYSSAGAQGGVSLIDIANGDGARYTFALGDAAGGTTTFRVRELGDPAKAAIDVATGQDALIDQSWSAGGVADPGHPWYGSVFGVTAQYGMPPDPRDEPMNRSLVTPTINGGDRGGDNRSGQNYVSGFRSQHSGGCNFLFCDGSARFVTADIRPAVYRALSTYAGGERENGGGD